MNKIGFFFPVDRNTSLTGGPRTVLNLLSGLQETGYDPILISQSESALTVELKKEGVPCEILELPDILDTHNYDVRNYSAYRKGRALIQLLRYNYQVASCCHKHRVKKIWARNIKGVLMVGFAAGYLRIPLIWDMGYEKPSKGLTQLLHWTGMGLATQIVTQSDRQFSETFGSLADRLVGHKVSHIYPGIDPERRKALRTAAGKKAGEGRRLLSIGNIHPRKNQAMAIQALHPLLRSGNNITLTFAGSVRDQDYYDHLRAMVDEENIEESVHFLGWIDDIPSLLGKSDLLILSSVREGIPHVIREAMFAQVPVVATRVGGVPEAVRHGKTGYLVDPNDHDHLRDCVEQILQDPDLIKEMGRNALEFAEERFSNSAWIKAYSRYLENI